MSSANIIGFNMFEAFFKLLTYKRSRGGPKIELCGTSQMIVTKLVVFFFIDFNELSPIWKVALRPIHDFCPLHHIVSIFWEEWRGLQCPKPSIGQWIHQVYICYFQKIQLFDQLIIYITAWSVEWLFWKQIV